MPYFPKCTRCIGAKRIMRRVNEAKEDNRKKRREEKRREEKRRE
jgi:hypothetical protein